MREPAASTSKEIVETQEMNADALYFSEQIDEEHKKSKSSQISGSRKAHRGKKHLVSNSTFETDYERLLKQNSSRLSAGFKMSPHPSSSRKVSQEFRADEFSSRDSSEAQNRNVEKIEEESQRETLSSHQDFDYETRSKREESMSSRNEE